jgi:hypothetical protein
MDGITEYLNTDLDLLSADDLTALAAAFEVRGLMPTRVIRLDTGQWHARFSGNSTADECYDEPEPTIAAMLAVIEALDPPLRSAWAGCSQREFDIGYDCGREPFHFHQGLSAGILVRLVAAGASLRVTLYADQERRPAERDGVCGQEGSSAEPGAAPDPAA